MVKFVPWRSTEGPLHIVSGDRGLDHAYVKPKRCLHEEPEPYTAAVEVAEALPLLGSQTRVFDTVVDAKSLRVVEPYICTLPRLERALSPSAFSSSKSHISVVNKLYLEHTRLHVLVIDP